MTDRPLRIVHVIARLNVGGAALHVIELAAEQQRRGHHVLVVAGTLAPGEKSMEYLADELGVSLERLPVLKRELSPLDDGRAVRAIRALIRAEGPDVLHTHTAKAGGAGRVAARLSGTARPQAVVHTYHGHVLRGYFGRSRETFYRLLERTLSHVTDRLIAVSEQVRDELVSLHIAPQSKFEVIPYGFDLTRRTAATAADRDRVRAEIGASDDTFVVGWVGRLAPIKRPLDLVRILAALVEREIDAILCLVGDGPERGAVEELARTFDLAERCRVVGYREALGPWYAAFDAFCLTSANEGTPVAAIEALAAERPVVATRVGGTAAVVEDGTSGFLAAEGDVPLLAGRLAGLALDPGLRARLGRQGAARMRELYAEERMVDDLDRLYRSLLPR
jgi:glycosyltransferase involved in cell wall biosynthesis